MSLAPVLVDGAWRPARLPAGAFAAVDPATGETLAGEYPVSSYHDLDDALDAAVRAVMSLDRPDPERTARGLEAFARLAEERREEIVGVARRETALPAEPRLRSTEFPRLIDQLRQAGAAAREGSWRRATIDTKLGLRSILEPLGGPVAVFSPSNFPLAFNSVGGGDFAAAWGAGNPVIAKAHPGHPGTARLFAEIAREAAAEAGLPPAWLQMVYHFGPGDGFRLVADPRLGASAFTGSRAAGLRLKEAADRAGKPVYLEMSSVNPVFILPGALEERGRELAAELYASCSAAAGQFCTKPALAVVVGGPEAEEFFAEAKRLFEAPATGFLMGGRFVDGLQKTVAALIAAGAEPAAGGKPLEGQGFRFANTLFRLPGARFLASPGAFQIEAFGAYSIVVFARDAAELTATASRFEGNLTGTIYSGRAGQDDALYRALEPVLRRKVGRLLNDQMPTGVAVSPAMNHGGPYPATGHLGFTSVGIPASFTRFAALRCYDHVRPERLPVELRDRNPTGKMWRLIDGEWTKGDAAAGADGHG